MRHVFSAVAILILTVFFALFLILPLYVVLVQGANWSVLTEVLRNRLYLEGLWNAFRIAVASTALVFLISIPLALLYDRFDFPGKGLCSVLMMAPMILPPFVGALGFMQILGRYGFLNTLLTRMGFPAIDFLAGNGCFWSICVIEALHLYPIAYLNLITAFSNIDPALEEAARNAGAGSWTRFRKITFPLLRPGIFAGGSIVLIWSFTELGTPLMFGYTKVTPVQVFNGITELGTNPGAYALVIVMLAVSSLLYFSGKILLGKMPSAVQSKGSMAIGSVRLKGVAQWIPPMVFGLFTLIAILPHLSLILISCSSSWFGTLFPEHLTLAHFQAALSDSLVVPSIRNSLLYSSLALVGALVIGVLTAFLTKRSNLPFAWIFDLLGMFPLMMPGIVMAVGFLGMSIQYRWARFLFDPVGNPVFLLAAAYAIRRIPYVLRAAAGGLEQTPVELEHAARNAGASGMRTALKIVFPLIAANLVVGALFAFSFSMLEVSDSLILAQKTEFYPITKAIAALSMNLGSGPYVAAAFGVWAMAFLASTLAAASILLGKKMGSMFRL